MISVILPTYNERDNIIPLVKNIERQLHGMPFEIITVDDDSEDKTHDAVRRYAEDHPHVRAVLRKNEKGFRSALQKGIDMSRGDVILWMDCDFSHPPDLIPGMIAEITHNSVDAAVASRFIPGSKDMTARHAPAAVKIQKMLSLWLNRLCTKLISPDFHDWTSGYIALQARCIKDHPLRGNFCEYFMELMHHLILTRASIVEIPFESPPRRHGETKSAPSLTGLIRQGANYLKMLGFMLSRRRARA